MPEFFRALDKSLGYLRSDLPQDPKLREQFRAASIQAFGFTRERRNMTSHTYNVQKAEKIAAALPAFSADVRVLLAELERCNRAEN